LTEANATPSIVLANIGGDPRDGVQAIRRWIEKPESSGDPFDAVVRGRPREGLNQELIDELVKAAYDGLAPFWASCDSCLVPDYAYLLAAAADYYRQRINTVLDLACGTGLLSRQLAGQADLVIGLDVSAAMLQEARSRTRLKHLHFVRGDFRDFSLDVTFD